MTVQMLMKNTIKTAVAQHFHKAQRELDEPCLCKDKDEEGQESHLLQMAALEGDGFHVPLLKYLFNLTVIYKRYIM